MTVYSSFQPSGSSRFPGKVLADIYGKPLQRVFEGSQADSIQQTFITTCDHEIKSHAYEIGANVIMTSDKHERCLDRVAEAYSTLKFDSDIILGMQGDEPLVDTKIVENR